MTQAQAPLRTPCWFHIHISYRFGGDTPIKVREIAKMSIFGLGGGQNGQNHQNDELFGGLMTQSKSPLRTPVWFCVNISYGFGGDTNTNLDTKATPTYTQTDRGTGRQTGKDTNELK